MRLFAIFEKKISKNNKKIPRKVEEPAKKKTF